jgi:hypothetical protein
MFLSVDASILAHSPFHLALAPVMTRFVPHPVDQHIGEILLIHPTGFHVMRVPVPDAMPDFGGTRIMSIA